MQHPALAEQRAQLADLPVGVRAWKAGSLRVAAKGECLPFDSRRRLLRRSTSS